MKRITTKDGFTIDVDPERFNDMRVLEKLADVKEGDITGFPRLIEMTLGKDGKEALYKFYEKDGRVPTEVITDVYFDEIMILAGEEVKNS